MRDCKECHLCCTVLGVDDIGKRAHSPCRFLGTNGCAIHDHKPRACRDFNCLWRQGVIGEEYKPDECGMILCDNYMDSRLMRAFAKRFPKTRAYTAHEITPGTFDKYMPFINEFTKTRLLFMCIGSRRRMIGPVEAGMWLAQQIQEGTYK